MPIHDIFEPHNEPAKTIYLAFQEEAKKRKTRSVSEWSAGELETVHRTATEQAQKLKLRPPSLEEIAAAERYARGSTDYGAKWAYQVVALMKKQSTGV